MQEMAQIIFTQGARVVFEKGATAPKNNEKKCGDKPDGVPLPDRRLW